VFRPVTVAQAVYALVVRHELKEPLWHDRRSAIDAQDLPFLIGAVDKAVEDMETGLLGLANNPDPLAQAELAALLGVVFGPPTLGVYELEFTFPNIGLPETQQEFLEATVVSAIGDAINEVGEPAYVPPIAGGTDDYVLRLTGLDLDIVPVLLA
jgi:hypothetical protein